MKLPIALVRSYAEMLPRLEAEETMLAINAIACGSGTLKKHDSTGFLNKLENRASGIRPRLRRIGIDQLGAMGIKVIDMR